VRTKHPDRKTVKQSLNSDNLQGWLLVKDSN
jgi:hypothetical protein